MADIILGAQWGDEGKGKIVDYLSGDYDIIVRFQGGNNAGHTVNVGGEEYKLHLLPSGIIRKKQCVIGNGVVVDLEALDKEIKEFPMEIEEHELLVSEKCHVIMFYHKLMDRLKDKTQKIGTTGRGIGPCYTDKSMRTGIRIMDLFDKLVLKSKLNKQLVEKLRILRNVYGFKDSELKEELETKEFEKFTSHGLFFDLNKITEYYYELGQKLKKYVYDTTNFLNCSKDKKILFEGAQGIMLDVEHGTYPYVTSSNTTIGSAINGGGAYFDFERRIGLVKAYLTRVGEGPFLTELTDWRGEALATKGKEFGTTTGRKRRTGWLDLPMIRYTAILNGFTELAVTKLDILDVLDKIKICVGYTVDGEAIKTYPNSNEISYAKPIYIELEGWKEDTSKIYDYEDLPENAKTYIRAIEEITEIPVKLIGVGKKRSQIIVKR